MRLFKALMRCYLKYYPSPSCCTPLNYLKLLFTWLLPVPNSNPLFFFKLSFTDSPQMHLYASTTKSFFIAGVQQVGLFRTLGLSGVIIHSAPSSSQKFLHLDNKLFDCHIYSFASKPIINMSYSQAH